MKMLNEDTIKTVEFWKDLKGFEGEYEISTFGRVKSLERQTYNPSGTKNKILKERILKPLDRAKSRGLKYKYVNLKYGLKQKKHSIHRLILENFPCWFMNYEGEFIDHADREPDNNHITNLRLSTFSQNNANMAKKKNCSSQYKGVTWSKALKKWRSQIEKTKKIHIGYYFSEVDAAKAYDYMATQLHGKFAWLNFPDEEQISV
jgi:hypothetical protein